MGVINSCWAYTPGSSTSVWRDIALNTTNHNFNTQIVPYVVNTLKCEDIGKVIFNDPATVMLMKDGTKVVVKRKTDEEWNPVIGLAMCMAKYACGNDESFHKIIKKWLPEY